MDKRYISKKGGLFVKNNCMIVGVSYYHPEHKVDNEFFIEHFKKQGTDISRLLEMTGRSSRYIAKDMDETMITMGYNATVRVLEKTHIKASQLNMIVFSSGTPEYIAPTNAMIIHSMIEGGQKCIVYDMNASCAGMVTAFEQIARTMRNNPNMKYALLIGAEQFIRYSNYTEAISYANFGDSGCALILENVFYTERGFLDSDYYTNSSNYDKILLPAKGMSSAIHNKNIKTEDKLVKWTNFNLDGAFYSAKVSIEEVLFKNNLTKKDIKKYFLSQFSWNNIEYVCRELGEDIEKFMFVGDEFGYTGTTSPFMAYATAIEDNKLMMGDYVIFWTVGAGTTCVCVLYQY